MLHNIVTYAYEKQWQQVHTLHNLQTMKDYKTYTHTNIMQPVKIAVARVQQCEACTCFNCE